MSLLVVGLNHRTVPVELLERLAVAPASLPKAIDALSRREHLAEVVLLSTCNRTEVYAHATLFHPALQDVHDFLADISGVDPDEFADLLYTFHDDAAAGHLFAVAAGLDSMIIGEGEILGQVREAWQTAAAEGASGPRLDRVFRHAIEVGKRVRTETAISRQPVSVSTAAVALANERLGTLEDRRVLVLGAGTMAEGMAVTLAGAGAAEIIVANRTIERAEALAARVDGRAIPLPALLDTLEQCDVLLTSTGSTDVLITREEIEALMRRRDGRALLVIDIGMPRDVDPGVGEVFGVALLDIDALKAFGEQSLAERRQAIEASRGIITTELDRFRAERSAREVAPLVVELRDLAEDVRVGELERFRSRLARLDADALAAVEALTQGIVNKLLHEPTVRVKGTAGTGKGEMLADALAELFGLGDAREDGDPDSQG